MLGSVYPLLEVCIKQGFHCCLWPQNTRYARAEALPVAGQPRFPVVSGVRAQWPLCLSHQGCSSSPRTGCFAGRVWWTSDVQFRAELKGWNHTVLSGKDGSPQLQNERHSGNSVSWLLLSSFLSVGDTGSVRDGGGSAQAVHSRARGSAPEIGHLVLDKMTYRCSVGQSRDVETVGHAGCGQGSTSPGNPCSQSPLYSGLRTHSKPRTGTDCPTLLCPH